MEGDGRFVEQQQRHERNTDYNLLLFVKKNNNLS